MAQDNGHGGYRPPRKPAPVSGPGKMSRRTDGQPLATLPDAAYGEQKTFHDVQQGAPMAEAGGAGGPAQPPLDMSRVTALSAASQHPNEPVTAGANAGAGPDASALGNRDASMDYLRAMLPTLEIAAAQPNSSIEFRQMVRRLKAS